SPDPASQAGGRPAHFDRPGRHPGPGNDADLRAQAGHGRDRVPDARRLDADGRGGAGQADVRDGGSTMTVEMIERFAGLLVLAFLRYLPAVALPALTPMRWAPPMVRIVLA